MSDAFLSLSDAERTIRAFFKAVASEEMTARAANRLFMVFRDGVGVDEFGQTSDVGTSRLRLGDLADLLKVSLTLMSGSAGVRVGRKARSGR